MTKSIVVPPDEADRPIYSVDDLVNSIAEQFRHEMVVTRKQRDAIAQSVSRWVKRFTRDVVKVEVESDYDILAKTIVQQVRGTHDVAAAVAVVTSTIHQGIRMIRKGFREQIDQAEKALTERTDANVATLKKYETNKRELDDVRKALADTAEEIVLLRELRRRVSDLPYGSLPNPHPIREMLAKLALREGRFDYAAGETATFGECFGPVRSSPEERVEDELEAAYWRFDTLHKANYRDADPTLPGPLSERDAFKRVGARLLAIGESRRIKIDTSQLRNGSQVEELKAKVDEMSGTIARAEGERTRLNDRVALLSRVARHWIGACVEIVIGEAGIRAAFDTVAESVINGSETFSMELVALMISLAKRDRT